MWENTDQEKLRIWTLFTQCLTRLRISLPQKKFVNNESWVDPRFSIDKVWTNFQLQVVLQLRKKCPHSELLWLAFSRIRTESGEVRSNMVKN